MAHQSKHTYTVLLPLSTSSVFLCAKPSGVNVTRPRYRRLSDHLKCVGLHGGNLRSESSQPDTRARSNPLHTSSSLNTTHHTSANPAACTGHSIPNTNKYELGASQERVVYEYTHDITNDTDLCISEGWAALGAVHKVVHFYSEPRSRYPASFALSCFYLSTVSPNTHHHLMMTTARLKTSLWPGNHGNALRRQAGWRPIGSGPWLCGWDHVILALTTLPQDPYRGLAPRTLLPRPITPNRYEWQSEGYPVCF